MTDEFNWSIAPTICELNGFRWVLGPKAEEGMIWSNAIDWCKEVGGVLPPREVLLLANLNKDINGGFASEYYWSSSEGSSSSAWGQYFNNGYQYSAYKHNIYLVWAVKAIRIKERVSPKFNWDTDSAKTVHSSNNDVTRNRIAVMHAHLKGAEIIMYDDNDYAWVDCIYPKWSWGEFEYRVKDTSVATQSSNKSSGIKYDEDKPDWSLLPLKVVKDIVAVLTMGKEKYSRDNWQKVSNPEDRYFAAAMRHLEQYQSGEVVDSDSGITHLAHASCCLIFLMWFDKQDK